MTNESGKYAECLVSVIMAVHNGGVFLPAAVESILEQSLRELEFVIVDDASTDGSLDKLKHYAKLDPRVVLVSNTEKQGLTKSLNIGAARSRGSFLARMDADDVAIACRLEQQLKWMISESECAVVGGQVMRIDEDGWPIGRWKVPLTHEEIDALHLAGYGGGIVHPAAMIRRQAFFKVGGYDNTFEAAQDFDLWLRLAEVGRLANLSGTVLNYRVHVSSISIGRRAVQLECLRRACWSAHLRRGLTTQAKRLKQRADLMSPHQLQRQLVRLALKSGCFSTARKHARSCLRNAPFHPSAWLHLLASWLVPLFVPHTKAVSGRCVECLKCWVPSGLM